VPRPRGVPRPTRRARPAPGSHRRCPTRAQRAASPRGPHRGAGRQRRRAGPAARQAAGRSRRGGGLLGTVRSRGRGSLRPAASRPGAARVRQTPPSPTPSGCAGSSHCGSCSREDYRPAAYPCMPRGFAPALSTPSSRATALTRPSDHGSVTVTS